MTRGIDMLSYTAANAAHLLRWEEEEAALPRPLIDDAARKVPLSGRSTPLRWWAPAPLATQPGSGTGKGQARRLAQLRYARHTHVEKGTRASALL